MDNKPSAVARAKPGASLERTPTVPGLIYFSKLQSSKDKPARVQELGIGGNTLKDHDDVEISGTKVYFMPLTRHFDGILGIIDDMMDH